MNTASGSRVDTTAPMPATALARRKVLVWDAPVRAFHWLMVLSFAGAYLTAESEAWRLVHVTLGYTMLGLVAFRLLWGLLGTRHARFSSFVQGPVAVARYLRSLVAGRPEHHAGHNPAGALAIVALLAMTLVVGATGWATYNEAGAWWEELHEGAANVMLAIVGVHVGGVIIASWLHRSNLIAAMVTGRKVAGLEDGVRNAWRSVAVLIFMAVMAFWWTQWQAAPPASPADVAATVRIHDDRHRR